MDFEQFLKNLESYEDKEDREECRRAFLEERGTLAPVVKSGLAPAEGDDEKLELSDEDKQARLKRKGMLRLHLRLANGLKSTDSNGLSDPYVVAYVGSMEEESFAKPKTLDPVWDEKLTFRKSSLEKVIKKGLKLKIMDKDGPFDSNDLVGKLKVSLECLDDQRTAHFIAQSVKPQGTIEFSVTWLDPKSTSDSPAPLPAPARLPPPTPPPTAGSDFKSPQ